MYNNKSLSIHNLKDFDFKETKSNIKKYFRKFDLLEHKLNILNVQRGLIANYDFNEYHNQSYSPIGKDIFNLSGKEYTEEQLKNYISSYYKALGILSDNEQVYIKEHFIKGKYDDDIVDILGFNSRDCKEYKRIKRSAVYKFADFLNLQAGNENNG